jgi:Zn-dependent M28 family amino/carboxypeptidase
VAAALGYEQVFIPEPRYSMLDDHTPFLQAGIPAVDIIDFDYPYWHTTHDTVDKVSAESLVIVGTTLQEWIAQQSSAP